MAVAADSGFIFRTLAINLSDRVGVQVDYWAPATPHLRVIDRALAVDHSVFLPGLRAGHTYTYEVQPFSRGFGATLDAIAGEQVVPRAGALAVTRETASGNGTPE